MTERIIPEGVATDAELAKLREEIPKLIQPERGLVRLLARVDFERLHVLDSQLDALDGAKAEIGKVLAWMEHEPHGTKQVHHIEGLKQAWGIVHEYRDVIINKALGKT
jgi:hypothetical protein